MAIKIWSGRSLLDPSAHITLHLSGLDRPSKNDKTGRMLQTWILRSDMSPLAARKSGKDFAICGDCKHRAGSCYVTIAQAPTAVHTHRKRHVVQMPKLKGRKVRIGAYGDPAAVPFDVWKELLATAVGWTGYTHRWKSGDQRLKKYCMASVDSLLERDEAHDLGWRTFRVGSETDIPTEREVLCPASDLAGRKMTCDQCQHCNGLSGNRFGDVFIPVHGSAAVRGAYQALVIAAVPGA